MKIETRLDTGDSIWIIHNNRITKTAIVEVRVSKKMNFNERIASVCVRYDVTTTDVRKKRINDLKEEDLGSQFFRTKEELLAYLTRSY